MAIQNRTSGLRLTTRREVDIGTDATVLHLPIAKRSRPDLSWFLGSNRLAQGTKEKGSYSVV
jgi:hypothetical protein